MDSSLISQLRTKHEAELLIDELHLLKSSLYQEGERSFSSTLKNNVRYWVAEILMSEIKDKDKEEYIDKLIDTIKDLKKLKLTLAFEPSDSGLNRFLDFLRRELSSESLILEIEHDPTILAGAVISYNGKYHDFSLVRVFDEEFESDREKYLKLIDSKLANNHS